MPSWVNDNSWPFLLTHFSSTLTLTASSTSPVFFTVNTLGVSSPGCHPVGDVNISVTSVPYSDVSNSLVILVEFEK